MNTFTSQMGAWASKMSPRTSKSNFLATGIDFGAIFSVFCWFLDGAHGANKFPTFENKDLHAASLESLLNLSNSKPFGDSGSRFGGSFRDLFGDFV